MASLLEYLSIIEYAYNSSFVFDSIIAQVQDYSSLTSNFPRQRLPISPIFVNTIWPPTPEKLAAFVPDEKKLRVESYTLNS